MIRQKFLRTINECIENTKQFSVSDFSIQNKKSSIRGVDVILEIKYLHHDDYYMRFYIPDSRSLITQKDYLNQETKISEYVIECESCPGELKLIEKIHITGVDSIIKNLQNWLDIMWDEMMSIPINNKINKLKEKVDCLFEKVNDIPDEYFSDKEKKEFEDKLITLEKRFQENLGKQDLEKADLENKLEALHKEIESLKDTLSVLKKQSWIKSLAGKVITWSSKPENQKMIVDSAKMIKGFIDKNQEQ